MFGFSQRPNKEIIGNSSLGIGKVSIPDWTDDLRNKVYQLRSVHFVGSATIGSHSYWYRAIGQPVLLITLIFMTNLLIKKASPPLKSLTGWQIISNSSGHELKSIDLLMLHNIWSTPCWHRSTLCSLPANSYISRNHYCRRGGIRSRSNGHPWVLASSVDRASRWYPAMLVAVLRQYSRYTTVYAAFIIVPSFKFL